jgi:hypothetical protein
MAQKKRKIEKSKPSHSPNLKTIMMVENFLKNMDESLIKVSQLKKKLPKKVNHNTLMNVLDYLDKSNKILFNARGIVWIVNDSPKLREAIRKASTYEEILAKINR